MQTLGAVAIGRNEGARLRRCLESLVGCVGRVVYVDSGSTDGSTDMARGLGVEVVDLDTSIPFTAARARNAGFARLLELAPDVTMVQFVDGDCEVADGWIETAERALVEHATWAVVCGRRRERFPEASIYNRLCDIEWDTPLGESKWCGGDAMIRRQAFRQVNGYDPAVIAGEEPEMCVRLRQAGWLIHRIDAEMTLHDAAMTRLGQWWKRNVRSGHAYAEGFAMHGGPPERHFAREVRSNWFWGAAVPAGALGLAWWTWGWSLLGLGGYPLTAARLYRRGRRAGLRSRHAIAWSIFTVMGKIPHAVGQLRFVINRWRGRRAAVIEYKGPTADIGQ